MDINITVKSTIVVLLIFFSIVLFLPAPHCVNRAPFKVEADSLISVSGTYCTDREWKSLWSMLIVDRMVIDDLTYGVIDYTESITLKSIGHWKMCSL